MKTGMKILVALALVAGMAGVSQAALVTMTSNPGSGPGGTDVYDFVLTMIPADGLFTNANIVVSMDGLVIQDPDQWTLTGGKDGIPIDTWVCTPGNYKQNRPMTVVTNTYDPFADTPPVSDLDWSFFDTFTGDDSVYVNPTTIARMVMSPGAVGAGVVLVITTEGHEYFEFDIPEPATLCLLGLGAVALIRRKR